PQGRILIALFLNNANGAFTHFRGKFCLISHKTHSLRFLSSTKPGSIHFLGSDTGGERAATMYSLLGSAKLNDINPQAYLRHVLTVIADHPVNRIDELLPWNVAKHSLSLDRAA